MRSPFSVSSTLAPVLPALFISMLWPLITTTSAKSIPYTRIASSSRYFLHSFRDFSTSTQARIPTETTPKPSRNVKGILVLPLSSMIALDTKGPMKLEVLPMMEKRAKNKNYYNLLAASLDQWTIVFPALLTSFPRGMTSEIIAC